MSQRGLSNLSSRAFNGGEWSPNLDARSDLSKYPFASRILENANVFASGRWVRRQGMELVAAAKYDDKVCRMIEFEFSVTTTFAIEVGHEYMRFYTNGAQVEVTSPGAWVTSTVFAVSDYREEASVIYRCLEAHTSGTFATDLAANKWVAQTIYEIATPYDESDVFALQFEGINDIVYFTHPTHQQRKLIRLADTNWTFAALDMGAKTAFLDESTDNSVLTAAATTGSGIGLTCSRDLFDAAHVGAHFKLGHVRDSANAILPLAFPAWVTATVQKVGDGVTESGSTYRCLVEHTGGTFATDLGNNLWTDDEDMSDVLRVQGSWSLLTTNFFRADILIQQSANGLAGWETIGKYTRKEDGNISAAGTVVEDSFLRIVVENWSPNITTPGTDADTAKSYASVMLEVESALLFGVGIITAVAGPQSATMTVIQDFYATTQTTIWCESAWSDYQGWPRALCFHEERIVYGGTTRKAQRIWFSKSLLYENFSTGDIDTDALSKELGGRKQNRIEWMESHTTLLIGTKGAEFIVTTGSDSLAFTNASTVVRQQTPYGSKHLRAIPADDAVLFITRDGKKMREMASVLNPDGGVGYSAPDITLYADHISGVTDGGFTSIAYQQQPIPVVWATTAEGTLVSCTYDRDQDVIGWTPHPTNGTAESVAVVTGPFRDEVWLSTKRIIDGSTKRFIERIRPEGWKDDTAIRKGIENAFYVDCGVTYDGAATTAVSAPHLANMLVSILADGKNQSDDKNPITLDSSGNYTLLAEASVIHVGLRYDTQWKPMRLDVDNGGDMMGQEKIVYDVIARFADTVGCTYGDGDEKAAHPFNFLDFRDTSDEVDTGNGTGATLPFTGDKELPWEGEFHIDTPLIIKQTLPLPMTLIGCVAKYRVTGNK